MPVGPIEPATKRRCAAENRIASLAGDRRGAEVYLVRLLAEAVFFEFYSRTGKRIGLDDVGAGGQIGLVNRTHDIGAREDEHLVTAGHRAAAEVRRR